MSWSLVLEKKGAEVEPIVNLRQEVLIPFSWLAWAASM